MNISNNEVVALIKASRAAFLMIILAVFISACSDKHSDSSKPITTPAIIQGQAILGPVINASVTVEKLFNQNNEALCSTTTEESVDLDIAGTFIIPEECIDDLDALYVITVLGGVDIDANDDGVIDETYTAVIGSFHAIISGDQMHLNNWKVSAATEAAYQAAHMGISMLQLEEATIKQALEEYGDQFLSEDISGDGIISYEDTLLWHPVNDRQITLDYGTLMSIAASLELRPNEMVESIELNDVITGHMNTEYPAEIVKLSNQTALVHTEKELLYIDISENTPRLIEAVNVDNALHILEFEPDALTVIINYTNLQLVDHSSGAPKTAGSLEIHNIYKVIKVEDILYLYSGNAGSLSDLIGGSRPETTLYKVDISNRSSPTIVASRENLSYLALTWYDNELWALEIDVENSTYEFEISPISAIADEHYYLSQLNPDDLSTLNSYKVGDIYDDDTTYLIANADFEGSTVNLSVMTLSMMSEYYSMDINDPDSISEPIRTSGLDDIYYDSYPCFEESYSNDVYSDIVYPQAYEESYIDSCYSYSCFPYSCYDPNFVNGIGIIDFITDNYYIKINDLYPLDGLHQFYLEVWDKASKKRILNQSLPKQEGNHYFNADIASDGERLYLAAGNYGLIVIKLP